jgi:hypothetical protein
MNPQQPELPEEQISDALSERLRHGRHPSQAQIQTLTSLAERAGIGFEELTKLVDLEDRRAVSEAITRLLGATTDSVDNPVAVARAYIDRRHETP